MSPNLQSCQEKSVWSATLAHHDVSKTFIHPPNCSQLTHQNRTPGQRQGQLVRLFLSCPEHREAIWFRGNSTAQQTTGMSPDQQMVEEARLQAHVDGCREKRACPHRRHPLRVRVSFFPELTRCGHGEEHGGCRGSGRGEVWVHL